MDSEQTRRLDPAVRPAAVRGSAMRRAAILLCLIPAGYLMATAVYALLNADDFATTLPLRLRYVIVPLALALMLAAGAFALPRDAALNVGLVAASVVWVLSRPSGSDAASCHCRSLRACRKAMSTAWSMR